MLNNPFWLQLDGTPTEARPPAALRVLERPISKAQLAGVQHLYGQFAAQMRLSVAPGQQWERFLQDGSRVLLRTHRGQDEVLVWPVSPEDSERIKLGGYLVLPHATARAQGWGAKPDAYLPTHQGLKNPPLLRINSPLAAGRVNWIGPKGQLLSWNHGGRNRYATNMWDAVHDEFLPSTYLGGEIGIYYKGTKIVTAQGVAAAAVFRKWLVYLAPNGALFCTPSPLEAIDRDHRKGVRKAQLSPTWTPVVVNGVDGLAAGRRVSAWHFAPDGAKAGCATVLDSYGIKRWSLCRASVQALPQTQRYVHLGLDMQGQLVAHTDEVAFAGQAWQTWVGPHLMHRDDAAFAALHGAAVDLPISASGRRLWGVDFLADGTEVVITCRRDGTGRYAYMPLANGDDYQYGVDVGWSIYANEQRLITSRNVAQGMHWSSTQRDVPGVGTFTDEVGEQLGEVPVQYSALSVYELDARFGVVVAERARLEFPLGVHTPTYSPEVQRLVNITSEQQATMQVSLELVHGGQLVGQYPVAVPAEQLSGYRMLMEVSALNLFCTSRTGQTGTDYLLAESLLCHGPTLRPLVSGAEAFGFALSMPQTASFYGESLNNDRVTATTINTQGASNQHLRGESMRHHYMAYPNQVSDAVINSKYSMVLRNGAWFPYADYWMVYRPGAADVVNNALDEGAMTYEYRTARTYLAWSGGCAQRAAGGKEAVAVVCGGFAMGMLRTLAQFRQRRWGVLPAAMKPTSIALGLQLATADSPLTVIDLKPLLAARLQMAGIEILEDDLLLDPVRAL